jgi:trk system potassium uptake protein TrkH
VADVRADLDPVPGSFVACSGSTGGGIKMMRAMILYKQVHREIVRSLHPSAVRAGAHGPPAGAREHPARGARLQLHVHGQHRQPDPGAVGHRLDLITAFSGVVACLNNTGPGLAAVGPAGNYQGLGDFQKWVLSFAMILGRLEIFTLLVVLTPAFWRR